MSRECAKNLNERCDAGRRRAIRGTRRRAALWLATAAFGCGGCGGPIWYVFPDEGVKRAKQEGKPMLLYFKAWDSTQHRNMSRQVLNAPEVRKELVSLVNIELEFAFHKEYVRRYRVAAAQVCLLCTPDGREVSRTFVNPVPTTQVFLDWLRKARSDAAGTPTSGPAPPP